MKRKTRKARPKILVNGQAKETGLLKAWSLAIITKIQAIAVRYSKTNGIYYWLSSLHFKFFTGKELYKEALKNSQIFQVAAKRHSQLVCNNLFKNSTKKTQKTMKKLSTKTFRNKFILEMKL